MASQTTRGDQIVQYQRRRENGICNDADPVNGVPGSCGGGFRNNGGCMVDADCEGAMTDIPEIFHNPMGLFLSRSAAVSHFKQDLQQVLAYL